MIEIKPGQIWRHRTNRTALLYRVRVVGLGESGSDYVYVHQVFEEEFDNPIEVVLSRNILEKYYTLYKDITSPNKIWKELNEV